MSLQDNIHHNVMIVPLLVTILKVVE